MADIYNVLIAEERARKDTGEVYTVYHEVGTAWPHKDGDGFNITIHNQLSVWGKLLVLPRKS